uniref:Uncharacterized protein n=1 Tax=Babesia rodhaini TaxID=5870 RepID=A0A455R280_BABRO|nr:hypothetical protein [Babesia rodhaini]
MKIFKIIKSFIGIIIIIIKNYVDNLIKKYYSKNTKIIKINNMLSILKDIVYINKLYDLLKDIIDSLNSNIFFNYLFPFISKYCPTEVKEMILSIYTFKRYYYKLAEKLLILDFEQDLIFPKVSEIAYFIVQQIFIFILEIINELKISVMKRPKLFLSILLYFIVKITGNELNFIIKLCYNICCIIGWCTIIKIKNKIKELLKNIKKKYN